jgi:peptidoglycan/LPS O-acetylase OafA/YrhL
MSRNLLIASDIRQNNFDLLRLCLAVFVLYSHCYMLYYGTMDAEPVSMFSHGQTELGIISVYGFFIISGFLIARSFENSGSLMQYVGKRALRIVPGFVVAFLISVLIVGPVGAIISEHEQVNPQFYFADTRWLRVGWEMVSLQAPTVGVCFTGLPVPKQVNGSLWTIQHEAICYLLIPLLAAWMFKKKSFALLAFLVALAIAITLDMPAGAQWKELNSNLINWPGYLPKFIMYFLAGTCCYLYRDSLWRSGVLAALALLSIVAAMYWSGFHFIFPFAGPYIIFYLAFHKRYVFPQFARYGDFSYGTYLYAWPVQQLTLYWFHGNLSLYSFFLVALLLTLCCAALSWLFVERRFLAMKKLALTRVDNLLQNERQ